MKSTAFNMGVTAFLAVMLVTLVPYFGSLFIAPVVALVISAAAGRRAVARARIGSTGEGARAGAIVGVGALFGSIVGVIVLALVVVNIPGVQEFIRNSEPNVEARIPYEWMMPVGAVTGVAVGFLFGLFDLVLAVIGGFLSGWVYDHNRSVPA